MTKTEIFKYEDDAKQLFTYLYGCSLEEASSVEILQTIQQIYTWASSESFKNIDICLKLAEVDRLSPELQIVLLRTTSRFRSQLPSWETLFLLSKQNLIKRGLEVDDIFQGL